MRPINDQIKFAVRDDAIIEDVIVHDEYRFRDWMAGQVGDEPVFVVDLGANLGSFTLLAASYGCKVVAVEADPKLFEALLTNLCENPWAEKLVVPLNVAATATGGGAPRWMHTSGTLSGGVMRAVEGHAPVSVASRTLKEIYAWGRVFADHHSVAFLKCDIEGSECEVFGNDIDTIERFDAVSLEWHSYDALLFQALLQSRGFNTVLAGCGHPPVPYDPTIARGLCHAR